MSVLFLMVVLTACADENRVLIEIRGHQFRVEVADEPGERQRGLMYRDELGQNEGMLFVYERAQPMSFWMRNTRIPLSIAYIDENRLITQIEDMEPLSEESVPSRQSVQYALEVRQGRFVELGIRPGDLVVMPEGLP